MFKTHGDLVWVLGCSDCRRMTTFQ